MDDQYTEVDTAQMMAVQHDFESCAHQNSACYWYDTDICRLLGYPNVASFRKVIIQAMNTCTALGEDPADDFVQHRHTDPSSGEEGTYKLSRFACFLVTQNANQEKPEVKHMQYMLARMADMLAATACDPVRLEIRTELSRGEKELSGVAKAHGIGKGIYDYAMFKDAGYKGMYNMSLKKLMEYKNFDGQKGVLYDRMGRSELAANLFRVTQTSEYIRKNNVTGQTGLERAALITGKKVRKTMVTPPEELPLEELEIKEVRKLGKGVKKNLKKIDTPRRIRKKKAD